MNSERTSRSSPPGARTVCSFRPLFALLIALAVFAACSGGDTVTPAPLDALPAGDDPERDLALLQTGVFGDIASAEIRPGASEEEWVATVMSHRAASRSFVPGGPLFTPDTSEAEEKCYETTVRFRVRPPDEPPGYAIFLRSVTERSLHDLLCEHDSVTREMAIVIAAAEDTFAGGEPPIVAKMEHHNALVLLDGSGFSVDAESGPNGQVWLVAITANFYDAKSLSASPSPWPSLTFNCRQTAFLIDASNGDVLLQSAREASSCPDA